MIRKVTVKLAALFFSLFVTFGTAQMALANTDPAQSIPADGTTANSPVAGPDCTAPEVLRDQDFIPEFAVVEQESTDAPLETPTIGVTDQLLTVPIAIGPLSDSEYSASDLVVSQDRYSASVVLSGTVESLNADFLTDSASSGDNSNAYAEAAAVMSTTTSVSEGDGQLQLILGLSAAGAVAWAVVLVIPVFRSSRYFSSL